MTDTYNAASILLTVHCTDTVNLQALCFLIAALSPHNATIICLVVFISSSIRDTTILNVYLCC